MSRRHAIGLLAGFAVAAHSSLPAAASAVAPVPVAEGLEIMPREAWAGGREPTGPLGPEVDVRFLLVHHTASANGDDPVKVMRIAYDFHTGPEKGWPDVAYNFFIDQFGAVWEARKGSLAGPIEASATGGSQGFAQLVCLLGDFTSQLPSDAAITSLNRTLAWLAGRSGIQTAPGSTTQFVSRGSNRWPQGATVTTATISGHRDMSQTACPGDTFYPYLVANVPAAVTALAVPPPTTLPATTAATIPPTTAAPATTVPPATAAPATTSATTTAGASAVSALPSPTLRSTEASGETGSTASAVPASPVSRGGSGRDLAVPSLVVFGAAAAGVAAILARRRRQDQPVDHFEDDTTGASS